MSSESRRGRRASLVLVGESFASGNRGDAVAGDVAARLTATGYAIQRITIVGDEPFHVAGAIADSLIANPELLLIVGGLGRGEDDLTREPLASALKRELVLDDRAWTTIQDRYAERGLEVPSNANSLAMMPTDSELIRNPNGASFGLWIQHGRTSVCALPRDPREFIPMFERGVVHRLRQVLKRQGVATDVVRTVGLSRMDVERLIEELEFDEDLEIHLRDRPGEVEISLALDGEDEDAAAAGLDDVQDRLRGVLGNHVYGTDDDKSLVYTVGEMLLSRDATVGTIESCTGGLLAKWLTDRPGSSRFFIGGLVTYANEQKIEILGIDKEVIERSGAVSGEVASAMAQHGLRRMASKYAISITGVAGPGGGSEAKPVGRVYIGVASANETRVTRHTFTGNRGAIREWSARCALDELRRMLLDMAPLGQSVVLDD